MISAPLVSIGLPTHDGESLIAQALESLLAQDHEHLEIVVSDNASTDRTPEIVREFMRRDSRIRHERVEELLSAPRNFNRAFSLTSGRYFMWAADDDLWDLDLRPSVPGRARGGPDGGDGQLQAAVHRPGGPCHGCGS